MRMNSPGFGVGFGIVYTVAIAVLTFIINTVFAFAVDRDARRLTRSGKNSVLVGPFIWAVATFIGGPIVAVAYWVVHHSTLTDGKKWPANNGGDAP